MAFSLALTATASSARLAQFAQLASYRLIASGVRLTHRLIAAGFTSNRQIRQQLVLSVQTEKFSSMENAKISATALATPLKVQHCSAPNAQKDTLYLLMDSHAFSPLLTAKLMIYPSFSPFHLQLARPVKVPMLCCQMVLVTQRSTGVLPKKQV